MSNVSEIVKGEFDAYYLMSDLPKDLGESFVKADLPRMAKDSADRLRRRAGVNSLTLKEVALFLESVRMNPNHEFLTTLQTIDSPIWTTDENWAVFRELLRLIIDSLDHYNA